MRKRKAAVLAIAAIGLWGCASQRDVLEPAPPGPQARRCEASIEDAARRRDVFTDDRATRLTTSNEGGWCGTYIMLIRDIQPQNWLTGAISAPPAHGSVRLRRAEALVHVEYRPQPGYVGPDGFTIALQPGFSPRRTSVQVVAAPAGAGTPTPELGIISTTGDTERRFPEH